VEWPGESVKSCEVEEEKFFERSVVGSIEFQVMRG
jgi:hypothetical protein